MDNELTTETNGIYTFKRIPRVHSDDSVNSPECIMYIFNSDIVRHSLCSGSFNMENSLILGTKVEQ